MLWSGGPASWPNSPEVEVIWPPISILLRVASQGGDLRESDFSYILQQLPAKEVEGEDSTLFQWIVVVLGRL